MTDNYFFLSFYSSLLSVRYKVTLGIGEFAISMLDDYWLISFLLLKARTAHLYLARQLKDAIFEARARKKRRHCASAASLLLNVFLLFFISNMALRSVDGKI